MSDNKKEAVTKTHYGRIARFYELGSSLGSGGQIQASKKHHLTLIEKPSRILYPGAGIGIEVVEAAKKGHRVTVVELDPGMLARAKELFRAEGVFADVECIEGSILDHNRPGYYDAVVASYLLDVFAPNVMRTVYEHLVNLVKKQGILCLSGYAPLQGNSGHKALQWANHAYANLFCSIVVNNARHSIYDYEKFFPEMGLETIHIKDFAHFGNWGPRFHRMWAARKVRG